MTDEDRADPAVRASRDARHFESRQRARRIAGALGLFVLALAAPLVAAPLTGEAGATVGALLGSVLFVGTGAAIWPWEWSSEERRHHELRAIWNAVRGEGEPTPWDRYAAWADADGEHVKLLRIRWTGSSDDPSPISAVVVQQIDADDIAGAAAAMEALREDAAQREVAARDQHFEEMAAAERGAHDEALQRVDQTADAEQREAEQQMLRELAAQEADERKAQAAAVARALRRP